MIKELVQFVLKEKKVDFEEIAIYFVTPRKIGQLHSKFFNDPSPTDCISFPYDGTFLGEIFVCPKIALEYAPKQGLQEVMLYIIHGILHLLGYDDIQSNERRRMHREQNRLLKRWLAFSSQ
jgi:probable rRNA maturation factor